MENKGNRWPDIRKINVPSKPASGGRKAVGKKDDENDSKFGHDAYKLQTEFDAKEVPGAAKRARDRQIKDVKGIDITCRTPENTPGCAK
jgi:hypothetical protein